MEDSLPRLFWKAHPAGFPCAGKLGAGNLFEHLTQADFTAVPAQLRTKLKADGTLNILQPNYRLSYKEYFDDYTHISIYSDLSLGDFLRANGYRIPCARPGFLPFSIKSRLPVSPLTIRLYLLSPWKPFAKQMFVRAQPAEDAGKDGPPC